MVGRFAETSRSAALDKSATTQYEGRVRPARFRAAPAILLLVLIGWVAGFGDVTAARGSEGPTAAQDSGARQTDLLRRAEQAERDLEPAKALALYRQALAALPGSRLARRARARIAWLEARSGGDDKPLVALMRMRALGPGQLTPARLEAFDQEVNGFPPGHVRREARALVAEAWLNRLHEPARAIPALERWLAEPGLDSAQWEIATSELALARADLGDLRGSIASLRAAGLGKRTETSFLELEALGHWARPLSLALIGAFVLLALGLGTRGFRPAALRRALSLPRLALGGWALGVPLWIAHLHRPATWHAMLLIVPASAALLALASIAGQGIPDARRAWRRGLTVLGIAAQLGVAYLATDRARVLLAMLVNYKLK